jgi:GxxExxY protein
MPIGSTRSENAGSTGTMRIIVEQEVVVALKSVERILPVHEAQTLTYPRLSGCKVRLLMNFNCVLLKDSLRRFTP